MRTNRRFAALLAVLAVGGLSQVSANSAAAADYPIPLSFTETSVTIEYGQYWGFGVDADVQFYDWIYTPATYEITSTSTPSGYKPSLGLYKQYWYSDPTGGISMPYEVPPLGAGTYTFSINGTYNDGVDTYTAQTPTPATLKVEKAKLGVELRVLADPSNGEDAIVTARFTGRFVEEYTSSFFPGAALSPAGTWKITVTDADGVVAIESNVERAAGDDTLATSFFWPDAEPGKQYTASAEFVPTGASANNFSIAPAADFDYTAPVSERPVPTSSASARPDASLPEPTGFGLPLWLLILAAVLILGLAVVTTILSVRLNRRSPTSTGEVSA